MPSKHGPRKWKNVRLLHSTYNLVSRHLKERRKRKPYPSDPLHPSLPEWKRRKTGKQTEKSFSVLYFFFSLSLFLEKKKRETKLFRNTRTNFAGFIIYKILSKRPETPLKTDGFRSGSRVKPGSRGRNTFQASRKSAFTKISSSSDGELKSPTRKADSTERSRRSNSQDRLICTKGARKGKGREGWKGVKNTKEGGLGEHGSNTRNRKKK